MKAPSPRPAASLLFLVQVSIYANPQSEAIIIQPSIKQTIQDVTLDQFLMPGHGSQLNVLNAQLSLHRGLR